MPTHLAQEYLVLEANGQLQKRWRILGRIDCVPATKLAPPPPLKLYWWVRRRPRPSLSQTTLQIIQGHNRWM